MNWRQRWHARRDFLLRPHDDGSKSLTTWLTIRRADSQRHLEHCFDGLEHRRGHMHSRLIAKPNDNRLTLRSEIGCSAGGCCMRACSFRLPSWLHQNCGALGGDRCASQRTLSPVIEMMSLKILALAVFADTQAARLLPCHVICPVLRVLLCTSRHRYPTFRHESHQAIDLRSPSKTYTTFQPQVGLNSIWPWCTLTFERLW